jgi:hypothetical protein
MKILHRGFIYESVSGDILAYHGTDAEFDVFDNSNRKNGNALGDGYYFTDTIDKAKLYGKIIITAKLHLKNMLDFNNITPKELQSLNEYYSKMIDQNRYAGHGKVNRLDVTEMDRDDISKKYEEIKELTKDYYHDRAKAELVGEDGRAYIQWMTFEFESGEGVFKYLQDSFKFDTLRDLGYDAFKHGVEIVVWDRSKIEMISK